MIQRMKTNSEFCFGYIKDQFYDLFYLRNFYVICFFIVNDIDVTSYANDKTFFFVYTNIHELIFRLQIACETLVQCFNQSQKRLTKVYYEYYEYIWIYEYYAEKQKSIDGHCENLLDVFFDSKLTFQSIIYSICNIHQHWN